MSALTFPAPPDLPPETGGGGGGGVTVHNDLSGRTASGAHTVAAITGLETRLPVTAELGGDRAALEGLGATIVNGVSVDIDALAGFLTAGVRLVVYSADGTDAADGLYTYTTGGLFTYTSDPFVVGNLNRQLSIGNDFANGVEGGPSEFLIVTANGTVFYPRRPNPQGEVPTSVDDLGFSITDDVEVPASAILDPLGPFEVPDEITTGDDLTDLLVYFAVTNVLAGLGLDAMGDAVEAARSTRLQQDVNGDPTPGDYVFSQPGWWHNVYMGSANTITLSDIDPVNEVGWADGTVAWFWHGNTNTVEFIAGGDATIRSLGGLTEMGGLYAVVTAVYRASTQEWLLYGDLA